MPPENKIFIEHLIEKSKSAFDDADFNFQNKRFSPVLNRLYYAMFYLITAVGYLHGFKTSKHRQLLGWFNRKMIFEEKIFEEKIYQILKDAFENRQESDYGLSFSFNEDDIKSALHDADFFISTVSGYIKKVINNPQ